MLGNVTNIISLFWRAFVLENVLEIKLGSNKVKKIYIRLTYVNHISTVLALGQSSPLYPETSPSLHQEQHTVHKPTL